MPSSPSTSWSSRARARSHGTITVNAPVEDVWPWLIQIGQDRAGFYSYTWLENLVGAGMRNASSVRPEWQSREAGESVWLASERRYHDRGRQVVALVEPETALVLVSPEDWRRLQQGARRSAGAWSFFLAPNGDGRTRFIIRSSGGPVGSHVFDALHFLMEQKMMRGSATVPSPRRAERADLTYGSCLPCRTRVAAITYARCGRSWLHRRSRSPTVMAVQTVCERTVHHQCERGGNLARADSTTQRCSPNVHDVFVSTPVVTSLHVGWRAVRAAAPAHVGAVRCAVALSRTTPARRGGRGRGRAGLGVGVAGSTDTESTDDETCCCESTGTESHRGPPGRERLGSQPVCRIRRARRAVSLLGARVRRS